MPLQNVDHPTAHRPMSLLLQALKQIERKAPEKIAFEPPSNGQAHAFPADEAATEVDGLAGAVPRSPAGLDAEARGDLTGCDTISLIRQYDASETATELALAGPVHIGAVPLLATPAGAEPRSATHDERRRRRFAGEVLKLLPQDERAVIALAPAEGTEAWPVLRELCRGLAALQQGEVLAIAQTNPAWREATDAARFSDLANGRGKWQSAVRRDEEDFFILQRGDDAAIAATNGRSLLQLWQELNERFTYIVVDAGLTDPAAALLLTSCDGTFAVVRLERTNRREAERLIARIRSVGGRACGCLVVD